MSPKTFAAAAVLACAIAPIFADEIPPADGSPTQDIKQGAKEVAHGVKEGAVDAAHGVKKGAVQAGHFAKKSAKAVGHAAHRAAQDVGHAASHAAAEIKQGDKKADNQAGEAGAH
jgi:hypothetical protein